MAYQSLYRVYRPKTFDELVGQDHIVQTLKHSIQRQEWAHAYLFCGPRGTGKTTVAKILAKAVNCQNKDKAPCLTCDMCQSLDNDNHPDILEIDAASNNGVDDIRNLIDKVNYVPAQAKVKVYIIDEVHMLSTGAFNALLKTLEEPPAHVLFILATTELQKVPATIVSRCQRFDFIRIQDKAIKERLAYVAEKEGIQLSDEALETIAYLAQGGLRDALTILEQAVAYSPGKVTIETLNQAVRLVTAQDKKQYLSSLLSGNIRQAMTCLDQFFAMSMDVQQFLLDCIEIIKYALVYKQTQVSDLIPNLFQSVSQALAQVRGSELSFLLDKLMETRMLSQRQGQSESMLEVMTVQVCLHALDDSPLDLSASSVIQKPQEEVAQSSLTTIEAKPKEILPAPVTKKETQEKKEIPLSATVRVKDTPTTEKESMSSDSPMPHPILTAEQIYDLMVLGDKAKRQSVNDRWGQLSIAMLDARYLPILMYCNNIQVGVYGQNHLLFVCSDRSYSQALNEDKNFRLFNKLIHSVIAEKPYLFITDQTIFQVAMDMFKADYRDNQLKPANTIVLPSYDLDVQDNKTNPVDPLEKIRATFPEVVVKETDDVS